MVVEELDVEFLIEWARDLAEGKGWDEAEVIGEGVLEPESDDDFDTLRREIREIGGILMNNGFTVWYPRNEGEPDIVAEYVVGDRKIVFYISLKYAQTYTDENGKEKIYYELIAYPA